MPPPRLSAVFLLPRCSPQKPKAPLPSLPAACQPFFCRVFWLLCRQALRARVPRPLRAPSAPRPAVLAAPKKPMPSSLHRKPRNRSPLPLLSAGARAPLSSPLRCAPWPLLGVFRVAGSGSLGGRAGIAISMPPAACAWCVCLVRGVVVPVSPAACAWCVCLVRVPGACAWCVVWCGVIVACASGR